MLERQAWPLNSVSACVAIGATLAAGSVWIAEYIKHRRRQSMEAAATLAGLKFIGAVDRNDLGLAGPLKIFDDWAEGENFAVGEVNGTEVQVIDVRNVKTSRSIGTGSSGSRDTTTTENQTVFLLSAGEPAFPSFSILRKKRFALTIGLLGLQGIEFHTEEPATSEQDRKTLEQFRRNYFVTQGATLKSARNDQDADEERQLFDQLEQLIGLPFLKHLLAKSEWNLELCPSHVAIWKSEKLVRPGEYSQQLQAVFDLYQLFLEGPQDRSAVKLKVRGSAKMQIDTSVSQLAPLAVGGCAGMFLAFAMFAPIFFLLAPKYPWIVFVWPVFGMAMIGISTYVASRVARKWRR